MPSRRRARRCARCGRSRTGSARSTVSSARRRAGAGVDQRAQRGLAISGTSPLSTSVMPSSGSAARPAAPRGRCRAAASGARTRGPAPANAASTASAPWPVTTIAARGRQRLGGVAEHAAIGGWPPSVCSTFGRAERIRVPLPAAMITTFNTMPSSAFRRTPLSGCRLSRCCWRPALALPGCGLALKLGYDQGSPLAFRWLDGYVDFDDAQSLRVRGALDEWFAWHRRTQLPDYADLLARAEAEVPATPRRSACAPGAARFASGSTSAFEHAAPAVARRAADADAAQQIANVEQQYAERNERVPRRLPAARSAEAPRRGDRARDRASREVLRRASTMRSATRSRARVADSPFDAELSYAERLRRQQDVAGDCCDGLRAPAPTRADADAPSCAATCSASTARRTRRTGATPNGCSTTTARSRRPCTTRTTAGAARHRDPAPAGLRARPARARRPTPRS